MPLRYSTPCYLKVDMEKKLKLDILQQPDDITCGPTCLQAVYNYYGDTIPLEQVIAEVPKLLGGGTLAVFMGCHALRRGYRAHIFTYDLQVFDPTWFDAEPTDLLERLETQLGVKTDSKLRLASKAYIEFLRLGGKIRFEDLALGLIRRYLKREIPVLTGLSATYLYRTAREMEDGPRLVYDDIRGEPSGHFVVLCGYNVAQRTALLADPLMPNPISEQQVYEVRMNRLLSAIMLGILTFDANLLVITPRAKPRRRMRR
jgi:hypothetical protein